MWKGNNLSAHFTNSWELWAQFLNEYVNDSVHWFLLCGENGKCASRAVWESGVQPSLTFHLRHRKILHILKPADDIFIHVKPLANKAYRWWPFQKWPVVRFSRGSFQTVLHHISTDLELTTNTAPAVLAKNPDFNIITAIYLIGSRHHFDILKHLHLRWRVWLIELERRESESPLDCLWVSKWHTVYTIGHGWLVRSGLY